MRTKEEITKEIEAARIDLEGVKGSPTEVYTRIVGYFRNINNWNAGKKDEYKQRKEFAIPSSCGCS